MRWIAAALALAIAALGALGVVWPSVLLEVGRAFLSLPGLYAAAALRIVMGAALFLAAPASRAPAVLRVLGAVIFVVGLATPLIPLESARDLVQWWLGRGSGLARLWAGFALALGSSLAWALLSRPRAT
jgi:hypothetical protein